MSPFFQSSCRTLSRRARLAGAPADSAASVCAAGGGATGDGVRCGDSCGGQQVKLHECAFALLMHVLNGAAGCHALRQAEPEFGLCTVQLVGTRLCGHNHELCATFTVEKRKVVDVSTWRNADVLTPESRQSFFLCFARILDESHCISYTGLPSDWPLVLGETSSTVM